MLCLKMHLIPQPLLLKEKGSRPVGKAEAPLSCQSLSRGSGKRGLGGEVLTRRGWGVRFLVS
jgi:hypothetical protein